MVLLGLWMTTPAMAGRMRGPELEQARQSVREAAREDGNTAFLLGVDLQHPKVEASGLYAHFIPEDQWTNTSRIPTVGEVPTKDAAAALLATLLAEESREVVVPAALLEVFAGLEEGREGIVVIVPDGRRKTRHWTLRDDTLHWTP